MYKERFRELVVVHTCRCMHAGPCMGSWSNIFAHVSPKILQTDEIFSLLLPLPSTKHDDFTPYVAFVGC